MTALAWHGFILWNKKNEVFEHFSHFHTLVQTQFQKNIQILRSDNGREFVNLKMKTFCHDKGLVHQTTCPYTPEQNGVSERKNRTLLEMARAMLIESNAHRIFWPEAIAASAYLTNRLPSTTLNLQTPLEVLSTLAHIPLPLTLKPRVFRCSFFVHIPKHKRTKLSPCVVKCVFVGYGSSQKSLLWS